MLCELRFFAHGNMSHLYSRQPAQWHVFVALLRVALPACIIYLVLEEASGTQKKIGRRTLGKITAHLRRSTNDAKPPSLSNQMQAPPPPPPVLTVAEGNSNVFLPACSPTAPSYLPLLLSFFFVRNMYLKRTYFCVRAGLSMLCQHASLPLPNHLSCLASSQPNAGRGGRGR